MATFIELINAIATLLWPLIVVLIVFMFRGTVGSLMESARVRKFSIRLGGQELSMDEVSEQQEKLISDLQGQLVDLKKRVDALPPAASADVATLVGIRSPPTSVLWVDDHPKNNSYFIEQLTRLGIKVDIAESTDVAKGLFGQRSYDYVISDMGRHEDGTDRPDAGIQLLRYIRSWNATIPYVIFASARSIKQYASDALSHGATGITNSPTELFEILNLDLATQRA